MPLDGKFLVELDVVRVVIHPRPFSKPWERRVFDAPQGSTIKELIEQAEIKPGLKPFVVAYVGPELIKPEYYHVVRPNGGVLVFLKVVPGFGSGSFRALALILVAAAAVAVTLAVPILLPALGPILAGVVASLAGAAVGLIGSLAVNALFPVQQPQLENLSGGSIAARGSPSLSLTGSRNRMNPYGPVPRLFGRIRVFPTLAVRPFPEIVGEDHFLSMIFDFGYAPVSLSEERIGSLALSEYENVEKVIHTNYQGEPISLYPGVVSLEGLDLGITFANSPFIFTTAIDTKKVVVDIELREGLFQNQLVVGGGGSLFIRTADVVSIKLEYRLAGTSDTFLDGGTTTYTAYKQSITRFAIEFVFPSKNSWDIQLTRLTADNNLSGLDAQGFETERRTRTHIVLVKSIEFTNPILATGHTLVEMRIRATDQISGIVDTYSALAEAQLPVYESTPGGARNNFYAESLGDSIRTAESYANKMSLVFTPTADTRYLILWSASIRSPDSSGTSCIVKIRRSGIDHTGDIGRKAQDINDRHMIGGAYVMPATTGAQTFNMQWKTSDSGFDAIISKGTMLALSLRDNELDKDQETSVDSQTSTSSTTFINKVEHTFTPSTAGDYLLICSCEHEANSTIQNSQVQVMVDGVPRGVNNSRDVAVSGGTPGWPSYVLIAKVTLDVSAHTIRIQHRSPAGGGVTSSIRNARIILLRLDKFQTNYYAENQTQDTTTSTSFVEYLTLTSTPASKDHLVFMNSINGINSTTISVEERYTEDAGQERIANNEGRANNRIKCDFAFWRKTYAGASVKWDIDYRVENSAAIGAIDDASIAVIELTNVEASPGGGSFETQTTRNPAWAALEVLRGPLNGRPWPDTKIDLDQWLLFAQRNDEVLKGRETRFFFDANVDFTTTAFQLINDILNSARAGFTIIDGKASVVWDAPSGVITQAFSPKNSWGFKASRTYPRLPDALRVRFINEDANYQEDEIPVFDDGFTAANAVRYEVLELWGIVRETQAWREGRYRIAEGRLRPEIIEFECDIENLVSYRGDRIQLQHDVMLWALASGFIKSFTVDGPGDTDTITLDEGVIMEAGKSYGISIRRAATTIFSTHPIVLQIGEFTVLTLVTPIPSASAPVVGDFVMFGEVGSEFVEMKIKAVIPSADFSARFFCVDPADAIHTSDTGTIPDFDPRITVPPVPGVIGPDKPVVLAVTSDETVLIPITGGGLQPQILVTLRAPEDSQTLFIGQAKYRPTGTNQAYTKFTFDVNATEVFFSPVFEGLAYDLQLRYVSEFGTTSEWTVILNHTVVGKSTLPPDVPSALIDGNQLITWTYPNQPLDFKGFQVRVQQGINSTWSTALPAHAGFLTVSQFDGGALPSGQITVLIKGVDVAFNESANASILLLNLGEPVVANIVEQFDFKAAGFPGTITGGSVVGGNLEADSISTYWSGVDATPFWTADNTTLVWADIVYGQMIYVATWSPPASGQLTLNLTIIAVSSSIEFRTTSAGVAFWSGISSTLFWSGTDADLFWTPPPPFQLWPGSIQVTNQPYNFRVTTGVGLIQGMITAFTAVVDVPDVLEFLEDFVVSSSGTTRLTLVKTFQKIVFVGFDIQDDGNNARSIQVVDKDVILGPLVKAFDKDDVLVNALVDFSVQGY